MEICSIFKCEFSEEELSETDNLSDHQDKHSDIKPFICDMCKKAFTKESDYNHHLDSHLKEKFTCHICPENFESTSSLYEHLRIGPHSFCKKCNTCGKMFLEKHEWHNHVHADMNETTFQEEICQKTDCQETHLDKKPFICHVCLKAFTEESDYNTHRHDSHSEEERFACHVCHKACDSENSLQEHISSHAGEKPHICPTCGKSFPIKAEWNCHICVHTKCEPSECSNEPEINNSKIHHEIQSDKKPFFCDICKIAFATEMDYYIHHVDNHSIEKHFPCRICNKKFDSVNSLYEHLCSGHSSEKIYKCSVCGETFLEKYKINNHLLIHVKKVPSGEILPQKTNLLDTKSFTCHVCKKIFSEESDYVLHLDSHSKNRDFVCHFCHEELDNIISLNEHLRLVHSQERKFKCEICGTSFTERDKLMNHISDHMKERPYKCPVDKCTCSFKRKEYLKRHLDIHSMRKKLFKKFCFESTL